MKTIFENTPEVFRAQGNVFQPEVRAKYVRVDGDLICETLVADVVEVVNGSLLCPNITATNLHADILGVFDERPVDRPLWTFKWIRPITTLPTPLDGTPAFSIASGIELIRALHVPELRPYIAKLTDCTTCRTFWTVFRDFADDAEKLYDRGDGTPLQRQFVQCLKQHGLPLRTWRF